MSTLEDSTRSSMEIRVLVAVALSLFVLFGFQFLFPPPEVEQPVEVAPPVAQIPETEPADTQTTDPETTSPQQTESVEGDTSAEPQSVRMENEDLELVWTNVGGALESARVKGYLSEGSPVELIPQNLQPALAKPLSIRTGDTSQGEGLESAVFEVDGPRTASGSSGGQVLRLKFKRGTLEVDRTVRIPNRGYTLEVETTVRQDGRSVPYSLVVGSGLGRGLDEGWGTDFSTQQIAYSSAGEVTRTSADDLAELNGTFLPIPARWAGLDSLYFTYLISSPGEIRGLSMRGDPAAIIEEDGTPTEGTVARVDVRVAPASSVQFFIGPKEVDELALADPTLRNLIDYGWLAVLVRPLLWALKESNSYIGNYGFSIIFLTLMINLILFPVRYKQMVSMKRMAEIQPEMKVIQERYKKMKRDDPRKSKMNEEVMALYKERGVNPLGGCLPLVFQMPFLFAFYQMLAYTIELRGAPFIFWIQDLAKPDPYYVTPIVMGATMVLQQKMTPAAGDAMQRRMMMMMPIMFTFFFLNVSSGLAVYFLFSNVFGMMFQLGYQKLSTTKEPVEVKSSKPKQQKPRKKKK